MLYAVAHLPVALTEGNAPDPATVVTLQQRGIIRRRARAGYLELTDDARFSLAPEPPDADRAALTFVAPPLSLSWRRHSHFRVVPHPPPSPLRLPRAHRRARFSLMPE